MAGDVEGDEPTRAGTQKWPETPPSTTDSPTYRMERGDRATGPLTALEEDPTSVENPAGVEQSQPAVAVPQFPPPPLAPPAQSSLSAGRTPMFVTLGAIVVIAIASISLLFGRGDSTASETTLTTADESIPRDSGEDRTTTPQPSPTVTTPEPTVAPATVAPPGTRPERTEVPQRTSTTVSPSTTSPVIDIDRTIISVSDSTETISVDVPSTWTSKVLSATDVPSFNDLADIGLPITALSIGTTFSEINSTDGGRSYKVSGVTIFTFRSTNGVAHDVDEILDGNTEPDLEACEASDRTEAITPAGVGKAQLLVSCDGFTSRLHIAVVNRDDPDVLTTAVLQIANLADLDAIQSVLLSLDVVAEKVPVLSFD